MGLIERLASAIACQEGWFDPLQDGKPNIPQLLNNPGDLVFDGQTGAIEGKTAAGEMTGAIFHDTGPDFAQWPTPRAGIVGLYRDLLSKIAHGMTLRQLIEVWAPPEENNTDQYLKNVQEWTGIHVPDVPLLTLVEPLEDPRKSA